MIQAVAGSSPVVLPGSVAQRRLRLAVDQVSHTQVRVLPGPPSFLLILAPGLGNWHSPVSEWSGAGLQIWLRRFESGRGF